MDLSALIASEDAVLAYFSTPQCNVCKALRPKVEALLAQRFPRVRFVYVDTTAQPAEAAQRMIFAVPTLVVFFGGRETGRLSRSVGLEQLSGLIERPYGMYFD